MFEKSFPAIFDLKTLNGTNGFTVEGLNQGDYFGISVSTAGDMNGDGKDDMVMGAYLSNAAKGASYVIFGQTSFPANVNLKSLNGTNGFSVPGIGAIKWLGLSVSTAGDVNGDGKADIVLGAQQTNSFQGVAYVIFGQTGFPASFDLSTLNGINGFGILGINAGDRLGSWVGTAGDINDDGRDDVILGAPFANGRAGAVYVIFGQTGFPASFDLRSLNGNNGFGIIGLMQGDYLGFSVNSIEDINGDGKADIAIGANGVNGNTGAAYVILGQPSFPALFNLRNLNGINGFMVSGVNSADCLGIVNSAGDVNGDGKKDIVLGAYCATNTAKNIVYVIFGQSSFPANFDLRSLNGINGFAIPALNTDTSLGVAGGPGGDINQDGKDDLIIGTPNVNNNIGAAYVIFGQPSFPASFDLNGLNGVNGFVIPGLNVSDGLGLCRSITVAGDIQGNGRSNIMLGAYGFNNYQGASYVIFGEAIPLPAPSPVPNPIPFPTSNPVPFPIPNPIPSPMPNPVPFPIPNPIPSPIPNPTPTIIHHPPMVLNSLSSQRVEVNQPFEFTFEADQIFNSTDGDSLTFSAQSNDGSPLPQWVHFDVQNVNHLTFTGRPLTVGDSDLVLLAKNPWNQSAQANFSLSTISTASPPIGMPENMKYLIGGVGFGALIGLGYGLYNKYCKAKPLPTNGDEIEEPNSDEMEEQELVPSEHPNSSVSSSSKKDDNPSIKLFC